VYSTLPLVWIWYQLSRVLILMSLVRHQAQGVANTTCPVNVSFPSFFHKSSQLPNVPSLFPLDL
jgi:hypothetical protein